MCKGANFLLIMQQKLQNLDELLAKLLQNFDELSIGNDVKIVV